MIKVTFKTPQTFLANVEQGGCFELKEFVGKESDFLLTKYLCYFKYIGLKFSFLYDSIESIEKNELIEYEREDDYDLMNKNHSERKQTLFDLGWVFDGGVGVWFLPNHTTYWFQEIASLTTQEFNDLLSIEHVKPTDL